MKTVKNGDKHGTYLIGPPHDSELQGQYVGFMLLITDPDSSCYGESRIVVDHDETGKIWFYCRKRKYSRKFDGVPFSSRIAKGTEFEIIPCEGFSYLTIADIRKWQKTQPEFGKKKSEKK